MPISYQPLWDLLDTKGITEKELAGLADISEFILFGMKEGKHLPTPCLEMICSALNCDISDVVKYVPKQDCPLPSEFLNALTDRLSAFESRLSALEERLSKANEQKPQASAEAPAELCSYSPDSKLTELKYLPIKTYYDLLCLEPKDIQFLASETGESFLSLPEACSLLGISDTDDNRGYLRCGVHISSPLAGIKENNRGRKRLLISKSSCLTFKERLSREKSVVSNYMPRVLIPRNIPNTVQAYSNNIGLNKRVKAVLED